MQMCGQQAAPLTSSAAGMHRLDAECDQCGARKLVSGIIITVCGITVATHAILQSSLCDTVCCCLARGPITSTFIAWAANAAADSAGIIGKTTYQAATVR